MYYDVMENTLAGSLTLAGDENGSLTMGAPF